MLTATAGALLALMLVIPAILLAVDLNGDNLDDAWEAQYGITTNAYDMADLVGWWQMDGPNGVTDRSPNKIDGTLVHFPAKPYVAGLFSNALAFTADSSVQFPPNAVLDTRSGLTFSAWFKAPATATNEAILATWNDTQNVAWSVGVATNGMAAISFYQGNTTVQTVGPTINAAKLYDGAWHQVAATWAPGDTAKLYVDGELEASGAVKGWTPGNLATFTFGQDDPSRPDQPYLMDEVRLYGRALAPNEITQLPVTYTDLNGNGLSVYEDEQRGFNPVARYDAAAPLTTTNAASLSAGEPASSAFTPWMTGPEVNTFLGQYDTVPPGGHPNYWDKGHWINAVEGRWHDGEVQFRITYGPVPKHRYLWWFWYLGINKSYFGNLAAKMAADNYQLLDSNSFTSPDGTERFQGVWHKVIP
jgi:hypothetical protein